MGRKRGEIYRHERRGENAFAIDCRAQNDATAFVLEKQNQDGSTSASVSGRETKEGDDKSSRRKKMCSFTRPLFENRTMLDLTKP